MAHRVCHLSYEFAPHIYGGLGRHVTELSAALVRQGWGVDVATIWPPGSPAVPSWNGVGVAGVQGVPVLGADEDWRGAVAAFDAALLAIAAPLCQRADVLHVHDWFAVETALTLQRRYGRPLVVTVHATERGRHQGWLPDSLSRFVDAQERRLAQAADRIVVCSGWMRDFLVRWWDVSPASVTIVPNGTPRAVAPAPDATSRRGVLFAGRCEYEKGGHVLLDAIAVLRRRGILTPLTIAGAGSSLASWQDQARQLEIADLVEFPGRLEPRNLASAYRRAACVAIPSIYEPFGLVAVEAMAAGAPVVAAAVGGMAEAVGDGGRLVPAGDVEALADAIAVLMSGPQTVQQASEAALRRAAQLPSWDAVAAATLDVYRQVTGRSHTLAD